MNDEKRIQLALLMVDPLIAEAEAEFKKAWAEYVNHQRNHFIASRLKVIVMDEGNPVFGEPFTKREHSIFTPWDPDNSKTVHEYSNFLEVRDAYVEMYVVSKFTHPLRSSDLWTVPCKETTEAIETWEKLAENHEYKFPANPIQEEGLGDVLAELLEEKVKMRNNPDPDNFEEFFNPDEFLDNTAEENEKAATIPDLFPIEPKKDLFIPQRGITNHTAKTFIAFFDKPQNESRLGKRLINTIINKFGRACPYGELKSGMNDVEHHVSLRTSTQFNEFAIEYDKYYNL